MKTFVLFFAPVLAGSNRALAGFGEEAQATRAQVRGILTHLVQLTEPPRLSKETRFLAGLHAIAQLQHSILSLSPGSDSQKWYQARSMQLSIDIAQTRVLTSERDESSIPPALLLIVCGWVVIIYMGLGVFMVSNMSVNVALGICALAFACSIFIILELDTPFSGVVGISNRSVLLAQAELTG